MKKLYTLFFIFFISISSSNSQWVTIPDTNFVAFLQQQYPQCMNGNQMDISCSAIVNETYLDCSFKNISNLSGIQYFISLLSLLCTNNQLTTLPNLPGSLLYLECGYNQITSIPFFPGSLEYLRCHNNLLTSLPPIPSSVVSIWCNHNQLTSLPSLPPNLEDLYCGYNFITALPNNLPQTLWTLECENNLLTSLPSLPPLIYEIFCSINQISSLPSLPNNLYTLDCHNNQLTSLPPLSNSINYLNCSNNLISILPQLNNLLLGLQCSNNELTSLPNIPNSLSTLNCSNNQLSSLPFLNGLTNLNCSQNQLITLPNLPSSLNSLNCSYNPLIALSPIPNNLKNLYCSNTLISDIPQLPDTLYYFDIKKNPNLSCLPELKTISKFYYDSIPINCLPNVPTLINYLGPPQVIPSLSTYPLCNNFNNPNNCDIYWNISGKVYHDDNNNCIDDASEQSFSNLKLKLFQNGNLIQQVYSGSEGLYSFDTDTGTFTYTVDTTDLPVMVTCPVSGFHTSILTPADSMDFDMDFGMQCKPGFDVGVKNIVRTSGQFFPANFATIKIGAGDMASFYGLTCAGGINGTVIINFTGPISFISEVPSALIPVVNGNILTYSIPDFSLINFNSDFRIIIQTDTTAQAGDQVCFTVNVTPTAGDNDVTNNSLQHCFTVVNSFDPNSKEVYPEGGLTPSQEWMTYTIHFQNTGNAPAQNIYLLDTLDNNLIASSFTLLSCSHDPLVQLFGNVVKFNFPNINLPDSTNDEPNSHGFVQYKVKMVQGLPVGTVISNTAYNYFDFNSPVATNTVSNMVGLTSISNSTNKIDISVFPNPTYDELSISFNLNSDSEIKIELYNSLGQIVKVVSKENYEAGKNLINFSVINIPVGVYHLKFLIDGNMMIKKVIKY